MDMKEEESNLFSVGEIFKDTRREGTEDKASKKDRRKEQRIKSR